MRIPYNPFLLSGYHSPDYFCDREEELNWLIAQMKNERNAVIHSWRRTGKTALLRHFLYHIEKSKQGEGLLIDLLGTTQLTDANKRIVSAVLNRFGELEKGLGPKLLKLLSTVGATFSLDPQSGTPQVGVGLISDKAIPQSLEAIGAFLQERKLPVVLIIDEFQQITTYPDGNAEAIFRSWMQSFPMIRFVFSGSHRHMMTSLFNEVARPFYRSAELRSLDPLPKGVYSTFIKSWFHKGDKKINDDSLARIFVWTNMQTYYVQLVCNKLYAKCDVVELDSVEEVFDEIIEQEAPVFSTYQSLFTSFQWRVLTSIARNEQVENPLSQDFISLYELGAPSSVNSALKALLKREFVIHTDTKYQLHDVLLMRWIQSL